MTVSRREPVASLFSFTVAFGITAPEGSDTTPVRVAKMDCAGKFAAAKVNREIPTRNLVQFFMTALYPFDVVTIPKRLGSRDNI